MKSIHCESAKKYRVIFEILLVLFLIGTVAALSGLRYENNDDAIISRLLSGQLLGRSQWRIFQYVHVASAYPLHLLYTLIPSFPWYGAWQILLRFLSFFLPLNAINSNVKKWTSCLMVSLVWSLLFLTSWSMQARIQYTSTAEIAAFMGFVCYTYHQNRKKALISFTILELAAYTVRPNGMELMLPLGASLLLFSSLRRADLKMTLKSMLLAICICLTIMLSGSLITKIVFANNEYAQANTANNGRGEMFDYVGFPAYEEIEDILSARNISKEKYEAFSHYLILDWDVSDGALSELAAFSEQKAASSGSTISDIIKRIWETTFQTHFGSFSRILECAWIIALFSLFFFKEYRYLLVTLAYHAAKLVTWGYLFYNGRTPTRVIYPLLLAETAVAICIFIFVLLNHQESSKEQKENARNSIRNSLHLMSLIGCIALFALVSLKGALNQYHQLAEDQNATVLIEKAHDQMEAYCNAHPENLYLTSNEIYAYVQRKLFDCGTSNNNYVYSGGWYSLLPDSLTHVKNYLSQEKDCYYVISHSVGPSILENNLRYLEEYFGTTPRLSDSIPVATGDTFDVYRVR